MADILISAAAPDRDAAEKLSRIFEARGLSVDWMPLDPAEPGNKAGIVRRRAGARVTVALWSAHSVAEPQILEDAREALRRGSLLAGRLEEIAPPPEFRACPTANLAGWDGSASHIQAGRLLTETAKLLERPSTRAALAMATARLTRSSGGGAAAVALRPSAQVAAPVAAPAATPAAARVALPSETIAPQIKADAAPVTQAEAPPPPLAEPVREAEPQTSKVAASNVSAPDAAAGAALLALTPAPVKNAGDAAAVSLEARPAPVLFAGEAANDALPLRPAKVAVSESAAATPLAVPTAPKAEASAPEPTYQTITFEPEPRGVPEEDAAPEPAAPMATIIAPATPPQPAPKPQAAPVPAAPRRAAKASGKTFLREPRPHTERDDHNHYAAILLGILASIALLAYWLEERPQDFQMRAARAPAAIGGPAPQPQTGEFSSPARAAPEATSQPAPEPAHEPVPSARIAIASDLPPPSAAAPEAAAPAPQSAEVAPQSAPIAPPTPAADKPASALRAPVVAAAPPAPAKPAFAEPSTIRERAAPRPATPAAKAKRLAEVGRALDARAARPAPVIAALAGAAPAPAAAASDPFDSEPSQTILRLAPDEDAFHLPGLAPSLLGAWSPEPPAPSLTPPVTDAQWNAHPARVLAQSALDHGSYKDYLERAQAGDRRAMLILGLMRQTGIGEARDEAKAFAWLRRAALAGEPRALAEAGAYYAAGAGVTRDDARAVRNFNRSAMLGAAAGKNAYGWALVTGRGIDQEPRLARAAFADAAAAGDPLAALNLGRMLADGLGGAKDQTGALNAYAKAADQGFAPAQYAQALLLLNSRPAGMDAPALAARSSAETLAALRLQQAAAQGYPPAELLLGALYAHGIGVGRDEAAARAWRAQAAQP